MGHTLDKRHFACLRAMVEGVPPAAALQRYLDVQEVRHVRARHQQLIDQVAALAKRRGDPRWRLIRLDLDAAPKSAPVAPTLQEWAEEAGLEDWSEGELQALYLERFDAEHANWKRREARGARLRRQKLALLRELERAGGHAARPSDLIDGWFSERTLAHLRSLDVRCLADLDRLIARGGRWWSPAKGFGPGKARRVEALLRVLLHERLPGSWPLQAALAALAARPGAIGTNRHRAAPWADDTAAIAAWLASRDLAKATAEQYAREAERFRLWCLLERGRSLADVQSEDCTAYLAFLSALPECWISRRRAQPLTAGWAPFRGQLTQQSQALAQTILRVMYQWMVAARHLVVNPWDEACRRPMPVSSRGVRPASTPVPLLDQVGLSGDQPASARMRWLRCFRLETGLGLARLTAARRGDVARKAGQWVLRAGQGGREFVLSDGALAETRSYFRVRGLDFDSAPADVPLLASLTTPEVGIGYRAAIAAVHRFARRYPSSMGALRSAAVAPGPGSLSSGALGLDAVQR
jgi:hypothetical protein